MAVPNISILPLSIKAVGEVSTMHFVNYSGGLAGDGDNTIGVCSVPGDDGEMITVDAVGVITVEAGGVVTAGGLIQSNADGKAVDRTTGAIVGRALDAADLEGDRVRVMLFTN